MPKQATPSTNIEEEVLAAAKALKPAVVRLTKALKGLTPEKLEKLPVGAVSDLLYDLRQVSKMVPNLNAPFSDVLDPALKQLEDHFIMQLKVGESSGVQGMHSRTQISESVVPQVNDWEKFYAHISRTKAFELLNKAVNRTAVRERWDARKEVPGVGKFIVKKVSCTKLGGKE